MYKVISGTYKAGVIKPDEPIEISESAKILITIFEDEDKTTEELMEKELKMLSPTELLHLAKKRANKLKEMGVTEQMAARHLFLLIEEIRQDAISRGVAVEDEEITE